MAIGPGIFKERYKDYSLEQLNKELEELKKYLISDELKQARQEEINKGIDDNNCITNVESEIETIESLIKEKENNINNTGFIRKTMLDENGMEYEIEEKFTLPVFAQIKWLGKISEKLQIDLDNLSSNSKRIDDIKATYYWNSSRGGISLIVSDDGSYLGATSSINFDKHLEEFKAGKRNGNFNENDIIETKKDKSILSSIIEKIIVNYPEFSMKPPVYDIPSKFFLVEKDNQQYLATILDQHVMNYPNKQNEEIDKKNYPINILVYNLYSNESEILNYKKLCEKYLIKTDSINMTEILQRKDNYAVKEIMDIKRSLANILDDILENKESINIEKYMTEYLPKFLLSLTVPEIKMILNSSQNEDKILKINCHSCNNEMVIDCSKLPTNIKTLDTMCPNCKSFIKYGNLNYIDETVKEYTQEDYKNFFYRTMTNEEKEKIDDLNCNDKISKLINPKYQIKYLNGIGYIFIGEGYLILDDGTEPTHYFVKIFKTKEEVRREIEKDYDEKFNNNSVENKKIIISATEKVGIPTKQVENTILFVSSDNAVIDNKKVLIDDKKFNFIINIIEQKLSEIKEIKNQQTTEFLNNHISYDNKSKIFNIKYNNEEITINYHTGTDSDKYINDLINLIIDILMKENKEIENEINSAFEKDLNNINSMLKDVENMIFGENKNFSLAKEKLLDFVKGVSIFENDNETDYYNFDDVIQFIVYTRLNKTNKKVVWSSIPFLTAYSYLAYVYNEEKNYEEA